MKDGETHIVVLAGPKPGRACLALFERLAARYPVIAADAGYAVCRERGVTPCAVVGDFDSLGFVPESECTVVHPCEKDESDGDLAFAAARRRGARRLIVIGAFGGRLDHELATLQLFAREAEAGVRVIAPGDGFVLSVFSGPGAVEFPARDSGIVSVFSASPVSRGVSIEGLKYELADGELTNRCSLGLSNECCGRPARISVQDGTLFVFHPFDSIIA